MTITQNRTKIVCVISGIASPFKKYTAQVGIKTEKIAITIDVIPILKCVFKSLIPKRNMEEENPKKYRKAV